LGLDLLVGVVQEGDHDVDGADEDAEESEALVRKEKWYI
jgi:hypothetical protein